jgi:hypothetical protein
MITIYNRDFIAVGQAESVTRALTFVSNLTGESLSDEFPVSFIKNRFKVKGDVTVWTETDKAYHLYKTE